jgi:hypothetical protein
LAQPFQFKVQWQTPQGLGHIAFARQGSYDGASRGIAAQRAIEQRRRHAQRVQTPIRRGCSLDVWTSLDGKAS